jgi:hypothetical protein
MLFAFCTKPPRVDYFALLLPLATFFLSVAVGIVALLQWRLAHNKLRLDLFDRRYKIYEATSKFVDAIVNDSAHDVDSHLNDFNAGTSNAEFLFDTDVLNYIQQVRTHAVGMRTACVLYESQPEGDERTRNVQRYEADLLWLIEQSTAMTKTFAPYLGFSNVKI